MASREKSKFTVREARRKHCLIGMLLVRAVEKIPVRQLAAMERDLKRMTETNVWWIVYRLRPVIAQLIADRKQELKARRSAR